jgi:hypothetical protein
MVDTETVATGGAHGTVPVVYASLKLHAVLLSTRRGELELIWLMSELRVCSLGLLARLLASGAATMYLISLSLTPDV